MAIGKHESKDVDFLKQVLPMEEIHSVLELGCDTGRYLLKYAKLGCTVVGFDDDPKKVQKAMEHNALPQIRFQPGDSRSVRVDQKFDLALAMRGLVGSYWKEADNEKIVRNLYRHLRKDGYAVFCVNNRELYVYREKGRVLLPKGTPERALDDIFNVGYTGKEICGLVEKAHFQLVDVRFVEPGAWNMPLGASDVRAKELWVVAKKTDVPRQKYD